MIINLLPYRDHQLRRRKIIILFITITINILLLILSGIFMASLHHRTQINHNLNQQLDTKEQQLQLQISQQRCLEKKQLLKQQSSLEKKMDNQRCLIQSLQKIFDVIPNSMTLQVLEVNQSNNTATLDGQINSISDADQLGKTLRQIKFVQQAKISQIEHLGDSNLSRIKYQLRLYCPITTA